MADISPSSLDRDLFEPQRNWYLIQIEISKYNLSYPSPENATAEYSHWLHIVTPESWSEITFWIDPNTLNWLA